jgi:hypothetical protein
MSTNPTEQIEKALKESKEKIDSLSVQVSELTEIIKVTHRIVINLKEKDLQTKYSKEVLDIIDTYKETVMMLEKEIKEYIKLEEKLGLPIKLTYRRFLKHVKEEKK